MVFDCTAKLLRDSVISLLLTDKFQKSLLVWVSESGVQSFDVTLAERLVPVIAFPWRDWKVRTVSLGLNRSIFCSRVNKMNILDEKLMC